MINNPLGEEESLVQLQKRARRRLVGAIVLVLFAIIVLWNLLDSRPPLTLVDNEQIKVVTHTSEIAHPPLFQESTKKEDASVPISIPLEASMPVASRVESVIQDKLSLEKEALPGNHIISRQDMLQNEESLVDNRSDKEPMGNKPREKTTRLPAIEKKPSKDPKRILEGLDDPSMFSQSPPPKPSAIGKVPAKYILQVAAYKDTAKAQSVIKQLKALGVRVNSEKVISPKGELTRVRVGPYASHTDAEAALKKMRANGISATLVTK